MHNKKRFRAASCDETDIFVNDEKLSHLRSNFKCFIDFLHCLKFAGDFLGQFASDFGVKLFFELEKCSESCQVIQLCCCVILRRFRLCLNSCKVMLTNYRTENYSKLSSSVTQRLLKCLFSFGSSKYWKQPANFENTQMNPTVFGLQMCSYK